MSSSRLSRAWSRPPRTWFINEFRRMRRSVHCEKLEDRCLLVSDWSNVLQPLNTSGDDAQVVSPIDALLVINELNAPTIRSTSTSVLPPAGTNGFNPPPFVDVNCDNNVTPLDALLIINAINTQVISPSWRFVQSGPVDLTNGVTNDACSPKIKEGSSLVTSLVSDLVIPAGSNVLSFEYRTLQFDTSSTGRALDAFEAALVDENGRSLVSTLGGGKDSFFNISEGLAAATSANATVSNNKVALSLVDVLPGIKAKLVLRLVNNDSDTTTSVTIPSIKFEQVQTTLAPAQRRLETSRRQCKLEPVPTLESVPTRPANFLMQAAFPPTLCPARKSSQGDPSIVNLKTTRTSQVVQHKVVQQYRTAPSHHEIPSSRLQRSTIEAPSFGSVSPTTCSKATIVRKRCCTSAVTWRLPE